MEPMSCKSSMANWSDLPQELVVCISRKIDSMQDFVIFGAVCKPWSSAATKENFTPGLTHQVPLLMLPGIKDNSNPIPGQCYNLRKGKVSRFNIPKTITQRRQLKPFCMSSLGWFITASSRHLSTSDSRHIYLLHPFKHEEIVLPTFEFGSLRKFVLSSSPSLTSDYTVMVSTDHGGEFAFWRPKDKEWNFISSKLDTWDWDSDRRSYDIAYYRGQFYIVDSDGRVLVFDIDDPEDATANKVAISESPTWRSRYSVNQLYLVESGGA